MEFVPAIAMAALGLKFVDFLRYAVNRDKNGVVTQLIVWASGVLAAMLFAHSDWGTTINFGGLTLHRMNVWSQAVLGLQYVSLASAGKDFLKAIDNDNTAKIPTLLPAGPAPKSPPDKTTVG